jgi:hypothetical protein
MNWFSSVDRLAMSTLGALSAISVLAVATASPALAARADNLPPPVVDSPTLPAVALSPRVLEIASMYRGYMRHAASVKTRFENGQAIEASLVEVEAYEPQQLIRGAVAYAAVIALQDPAFVAGVRVYAVNSAIRRDFADRIMADPNYVTGMPGAATAASMIMAAMSQHGQRMAVLGGQIRAQAYEVQRAQPWSKTFVADREARLARAKQVSTAPMTPTREDVRELAAAVSGSDAFVNAELPGAAGAEPASPPFTPFVARGLAIAALAALGEGGEENETALESLLNDTTAGFCLNMSKLNLYQCLAVAKPYYEDMFCLGLHALADTGQCIAKAAGVTTASIEAATSVMAPTAGPTVAAQGHSSRKPRHADGQ